MTTRLMERWIESGSEIARLSTEGVATYWSGALARGAAPWDMFDDVRRWWTEASRQERPAGTRPTRSCSSARSPACATSRDGSRRERGADAGAAAAGRPRLLHRRLLPHAEPDEGHQGRRAGARVLARVDRRDRRDPRRGDRGLPGLRRALDRAHRRPGQPDRRLPGRLAGRDLRGAAPRARQYADARGRADRLPRRRARDPRLGPGARQRRPRVLPLGGRAGRRRAQGRAHAQRLHPDQAGERDRQADAADERTSRRRPPRAPPPLRDVVQARAGHPGRLLPLDRRAPVHGEPARRGHAGDRRRARRPRAHRLPAVPARRRARPHHAARRRCSPRPTTSAPRPPTSRST